MCVYDRFCRKMNALKSAKNQTAVFEKVLYGAKPNSCERQTQGHTPQDLFAGNGICETEIHELLPFRSTSHEFDQKRKSVKAFKRIPAFEMGDERCVTLQWVKQFVSDRSNVNLDFFVDALQWVKQFVSHHSNVNLDFMCGCIAAVKTIRG